MSTRGELHQWRWADSEPYRHHDNPNIFHPKTLLLNLVYEKVVHISATAIRCSVSTEQQRIATWMDEQLGQAAAGKLEHAATAFAELGTGSERIAGLYTCTMYTVVRMDSGALHWWGVIPFGQRKRLWDKHKAKARKPTVRTATPNAPDIIVGTQVCMKSSPMYQPGAIGFTISNGVPRVGQLLNAAWDLSDVCRFKLITVPPLPSSNPPNSSLTSNDLKDLLKSSTAASVSTAPPATTAASGTATTTTVQSSAPAGSTASGSSSSSSAVVAGSSSTSTLATPALSSANVVSLSAVSKSSGSNKETADRLDMPPPPSPASSTCSDTGSVTSHKRTKRAAPKEDMDSKKDEEPWMLR